MKKTTRPEPRSSAFQLPCAIVHRLVMKCRLNINKWIVAAGKLELSSQIDCALDRDRKRALSLRLKQQYRRDPLASVELDPRFVLILFFGPSRDTAKFRLLRAGQSVVQYSLHLRIHVRAGSWIDRKLQARSRGCCGSLPWVPRLPVVSIEDPWIGGCFLRSCCVLLVISCCTACCGQCQWSTRAKAAYTVLKLLILLDKVISHPEIRNCQRPDLYLRGVLHTSNTGWLTICSRAVPIIKLFLVSMVI